MTGFREQMMTALDRDVIRCWLGDDGETEDGVAPMMHVRDNETLALMVEGDSVTLNYRQLHKLIQTVRANSRQR